MRWQVFWHLFISDRVILKQTQGDPYQTDIDLTPQDIIQNGSVAITAGGLKPVFRITQENLSKVLLHLFTSDMVSVQKASHDPVVAAVESEFITVV